MALPILDGNQSATTLSTILSSGQHITAHTVVSLGTQAITDIASAVSGTSVCVGAISISGTVTIGSALPTGTNRIGVVTIGAGTVTLGAGTQKIGSVTAFGRRTNYTDGIEIPIVQQGDTGFGYGYNDNPFIPIRIITNQNGQASDFVGDNTGGNLPISGTVTVGNSVTIGSIPNGALTTRFGSITTANTAFATTAVTNTSRKYLMIQNIASTVITVGIGFTPTTTQGIQLSAGALVTYDGNYIPTGAVRILSAVTSSNFTVLEA